MYSLSDLYEYVVGKMEKLAFIKEGRLFTNIPVNRRNTLHIRIRLIFFRIIAMNLRRLSLMGKYPAVSQPHK